MRLHPKPEPGITVVDLEAHPTVNVDSKIFFLHYTVSHEKKGNQSNKENVHMLLV